MGDSIGPCSCDTSRLSADDRPTTLKVVTLQVVTHLLVKTSPLSVHERILLVDLLDLAPTRVRLRRRIKRNLSPRRQKRGKLLDLARVVVLVVLLHPWPILFLRLHHQLVVAGSVICLEGNPPNLAFNLQGCRQLPSLQLPSWKSWRSRRRPWGFVKTYLGPTE